MALPGGLCRQLERDAVKGVLVALGMGADESLDVVRRRSHDPPSRGSIWWSLQKDVQPIYALWAEPLSPGCFSQAVPL
ncbi:hypothetical protein GCM10010116_51490 [Microbispora rosea subsp. aerata]|nr:hypothetical protein GCM10010116_51490 [Microbispora rosea subsp. aerata]